MRPLALTLTLTAVGGGILELNGPGSQIEMGGSFLSIGCAANVMPEVTYFSHSRMFEGIPEANETVRANLRNVPSSCTDAAVGTPCVSQDPYYPKLFSCVWVGEASNITEGPVAAQAVVEHIGDHATTSMSVFVDCPVLSGELLYAATGFTGGEAPMLRLVLAHGIGELKDIPFAGVPGADRVTFNSLPKPPSPPPPSPLPFPPPSPSPPSIPPATGSCAQKKAAAEAAGNSFSSGTYELTLPSGGTISTSCDTDGWTLVISFSGSASINQVGAVGTMPTTYTSGLAKLSDDDINNINALDTSIDYFKIKCGSYNRQLYRAAGYTSVISQTGWQLDRDNDGTMDCDADRTGYIFADYPETNLAGRSTSCGTSTHMDWGPTSGCYNPSDGGWGQSGEMWVY